MTRTPLLRSSLGFAGIAALATFDFGMPTASAEDLPSQKMTLREVVALTLQNNGNIEVSNLSKLIEAERIKAANVSLDPKIEGSYVYQWINTPQNTQDFVATGGGTGSSTNPADPVLTSPRVFEQRNHVAKLSVSQKLSTGTTLELGTTYRVLDNTLNRQLPPAIFSPEHESFTGLTITQPLLRDFGMRVNLAEIRIAKANAKIAEYEWQAQAAQMVAEAMKRYYEVVFTQRNIDVQHEAMDLAQKLFDDTSKRGKAGVATDNDVRVAAAGVSQRQEELLAAMMQGIERQNALQLLFRTADDVIERGSRVYALDSLFDRVPATNRTDMITLAMANRYEIHQSDEALLMRAEQTKVASNQACPRLDLVASGGLHGMAGGTGSTYSEAFSGQGPEWTVGAQFSIPLNNDNFKAGKRIAMTQEQQAHVQRQRVRLQVALEVDTVLARLGADRGRLDAARKSEEAARLSAEGEVKRLEQGVSTSLQVLQLQRDHAQARSRVFAVLTDINKDLVDLDLATGMLLEKQNILLDQARSSSIDSKAAPKKVVPVTKTVAPVRPTAPATQAQASTSKPTVQRGFTPVSTAAKPKTEKTTGTYYGGIWVTPDAPKKRSWLPWSSSRD